MTRDTTPRPAPPSSGSATSTSEWNGLRIWNLLKTPVTLLVLLGILAFGAWYGKYLLDTAPTGTQAIPCTTLQASKLTTKQVTVQVENGGTQRGLARSVAKNLAAAGFMMQNSRNSDDRVTQTIIVGAKEDAPEVRLVAGFFKNAKIETDSRVSGTVTVKVGNDFAGFVQTAPTSVDVAGGQVCLATPTTTAPIPGAGTQQP